MIDAYNYQCREVAIAHRFEIGRESSATQQARCMLLLSLKLVFVSDSYSSLLQNTAISNTHTRTRNGGKVAERDVIVQINFT